MKRALIVRGGALGDLILTLPAVAALRLANPNACIEMLTNSSYQPLLQQCARVTASQVLDALSLAPFFSDTADLPDDLAKWFASFDVVISYLNDPNRIFEANVRATGVATFIVAPWRIVDGPHATRQLAEPMTALGIDGLNCFPAFRFENTRTALPPGVVAIHPGSGSARKNWPMKKWIELGDRLLGQGVKLLVITGEADQAQREILEPCWNCAEVQFANGVPLPRLVAQLSGRLFLGHDSGVSHLAAASGASCILLFGPTNPDVWAPLNDRVQIMRAPDDDLAMLEVSAVRAAIDHELMRIGIST